jgi:hypothetical protein
VIVGKDSMMNKSHLKYSKEKEEEKEKLPLLLFSLKVSNCSIDDMVYSSRINLKILYLTFSIVSKCKKNKTKQYKQQTRTTKKVLEILK